MSSGVVASGASPPIPAAAACFSSSWMCRSDSPGFTPSSLRI